MPKKHVKTVAASPLPVLAETDRKEHAKLLKWISKVERIRKTYAAAIISGGITGGEEYWTGVVGSLAYDESEHEYAALTEFFDKLADAAPGSTKMACNGRKDDARDLLTAISNAYCDAGFLVGLAVGMQLGPDAFKTGGA